MKQTLTILGTATIMFLTSCGNSSYEDMQSGEELQKMRAEIAAEREAIADVIAEESEDIAGHAINSELLLDKWWVADETHGGTDQFFGKDGVYDTDFGHPGTWEWSEEGKTMKIIDNGQEVKYEFMELSETKLRFKYNDFVYTYYPKQ
jgi:hypothetical protein